MYAVPSSKSIGPSAVYVDVADETDCQRFRSRPRRLIPSFCSITATGWLKGKPILFQISIFAGRPRVFAGARAWREVVRSGGLGYKLKAIPLAVFLEKEAQQLLLPGLSAEQQDCVLTYAGTHPYIFKLLQAEFLRMGPGVRIEQVVTDVKKSLSSVFPRLCQSTAGTFEHQVLAYVIEADKPVNPREIARAIGLPTIKPVADTLCFLGLVARWIRDEEATLTANSRLFNEWYRETVAS